MPALLLPLLSHPLLLPPADIVQQHAQEKRAQHSGHHQNDILINRPSLLLDGLHRNIAHQENTSPVHRPHIVEGVLSPDVVVKEDIPPLVQTRGHLQADIRVLDVVGPVEVVQLQMAGAALPHPLGLEDKPFALRVHDIQRRLLIIKPVGGKGTVYGVVDILDVKRPQLLSVPLHRAFDGIGPGAHIIHIGLGHRHPGHSSPGREVQPRLGEGLPGVGEALLRPCGDHRHLGHGSVLLIGPDKRLRVLGPGQLPGDQALKLRLAIQNRLNGALDQVQAFAQVLNGGGGHLPGRSLCHCKYDGAEYKKDQQKRERQKKAPPLFLFLWLFFHFTISIPTPARGVRQPFWAHTSPRFSHGAACPQSFFIIPFSSF